MSSGGARQAGGLLGVGAVACLACCIGPVVAFLGGATAAGLAATLAVGVVGLVVAIAAAGAAIVLVRRRARCAPAPDAVVVASPVRRREASRV